MGCGRHSEAARYPLGAHDYEIRAQFHEGTFHAAGLGPRLGAQRHFLDVWECDLESVRHRLGCHYYLCSRLKLILRWGLG
jgi:hypothetical protein